MRTNGRRGRSGKPAFDSYANFLVNSVRGLRNGMWMLDDLATVSQVSTAGELDAERAESTVVRKIIALH